MKFEGTVLNAQTTMPVPGVKILALVNEKCVQIGTTDQAGRYLVNAPSSPMGIGFKVPGYSTLVIDQGQLQEFPDVMISPGGRITGIGGAVPTWAMFAGGAAALVALSSTGSRKISGSFKWEKLIMPAAIIVGGYLVLSKLGLFGSADNSTNNQAAAAQTAAADQQAYQSVGANPTLSESNAQGIADDIFTQATSSVWSNQVSADAQDKIVGDVVRSVQNAADWFLIKLQYGSRKIATSPYSTCALLGFNCQVFNLDATIKGALDQDHISDIAGFLNSKGINYQF
jgi:hypothetical protein